MAFVEKQFPVAVSYGATGGPMRPTVTVTLRSGFEHRNQPWEFSLRSYDASVGIRDEQDLYEVLDFWENQRGSFSGFRWKDWADYRSGKNTAAPTSSDEFIGTGDGTTRVFQLQKMYGTGANQYYRTIYKPVAGTLAVSEGGSPTTAFGYDTTNGSLIFQMAPGNGVDIYAGFEFDVPARFEDDNLNTRIEYFQAGDVTNVNIKELRISPSATSQADIDLLDDYFNAVITKSELPANIEVP